MSHWGTPDGPAATCAAERQAPPRPRLPRGGAASEEVVELRRRSLALLCRSLCAGRAAPEQDSPDAAWQAAWAEAAAADCARELEAATWSSFGAGAERAPPAAPGVPGAAGALRAYRAKVRSWAATLRRPESMELRRLVMDGQVGGRDIAERGEEEFLPAGLLSERQRHRKEGLLSVWHREQALDFFDANLSCPECQAIGARYSILREAWLLPRCTGNQGHMRRDTGRSILAECVQCSERWQQDEVQ
ncbi:unnamed protein product [Prorocentrum cordatum]|uniref:TFIIS central domain-containing protein n=1 Tax=Prorocentrum cordatum TaxID=2364126 RepID=A0ABN9WLP6_9DINO|nr:unnamed protein product [Polarella glacialis]